MPIRTALDALSLPPTRLVRSSWPWRSALYLAGGALPAAPAIVLLLRYGIDDPVPVLLAAVSTLAVGAVVFGRLERWRLRLVDSVPVPNPHQPLPPHGWRRAVRIGMSAHATAGRSAPRYSWIHLPAPHWGECGRRARPLGWGRGDD